jgi:tellurite resistance protein
MQIPQLDRSNYLKGLLITARKDEHLTDSEKNMIRKLSERLGFSSDFFEETINSLLENKYIKDDPIVFSEQNIAKSFIEDGLRLSLIDETVSSVELDWLKQTASANSIDEKWVDDRLKEFKTKPHLLGRMDFALYSLI